MRMPVRHPLGALAAAILFASAAEAQQQTRALTTPVEHFGHEIGADYVLPDYEQLTAYWKKLDAESDRMKLVSIGSTAEGREQLMAIVTSPENHARLERYREISATMARAEGVSEEQARALAAEGKAVVWIDGGLHATEVLGAQQLMETVWQLVSRDDAETRRILDDIVILAVHANPDGMELVSDWYMRASDPERRSTSALPRLYQKYVGHDNNRDFYASTQPETENMNRVMFREWYPQIVYNHHQTGPTGTVLFAPPFRDPFNYNIDPLVITSLDQIGSAMHARFAAEKKPGATMREGANYSTWWNGGLRTVTYFHNMIGLLTETIGSPTPMDIPFIPHRQLPSGDLPYPVAPQTWHFRQSIDYSATANYAVLDYASRNKDHLLMNIWRMGRNAIEAGGRDSWTVWPRRIDAVRQAMEKDRNTVEGGGVMNVGGFTRGAPDAEASRKYYAMLRTPETRDPRGYVIPADQPDFATAVKFVNTLMETGIVVHRATRDFEVAGERYPAGSYVVRTAQAFRPHVLDMFEPQDHPDDFAYPGGPPIPPYDATGWTLAFQMGIEFDRVLDGFDGPFEVIEGVARVPAGEVVAASGKTAGYLLSHAPNDAFVAVNRLVGDDARVYWLAEELEAAGARWPAGTFFVTEAPGVRPALEKLARERGLRFVATSKRPGGEHLRMRPVRVALWDRYGGSMPSGWVRWILEQFEQPYEVVYPQTLDAGDLRSKYDVIVFVDGAIPERDGAAFGYGDDMAERFDIPEEYRDRLGGVSVARTVPRLEEFLEAGGAVVTIGGSTALAGHLELPVSSALVETVDGEERRLPRDKYFIPGSILQAAVDTGAPLAAGLGPRVDVMWDNSPAFRLGEDAAKKGVRAVAWFDSATPLRSGWAWGQEHLQGAAAIVEADVGEGKLFLFAPEITFRAQPHGTFKFLFNALHYGVAERERVK